ncbi:MAG: efflux RND transporter periplasmic adaptor subunit [Candidatus Humimicrobiaceae bacterium]
MKNKIKILSILLTVSILIFQLALTSCQRDTEPEIKTFTVKRDDVVQTVTSTGHVVADQQKNYALQSSGEVLITLEKGEKFQKGDTIFKIDNQRTKLNIENAEENLKIAQSSLDQAKINYQQALDANHIAVQLAESNKDLAEQNTQNALIALNDAYRLANESNDYAEAALESARTSLVTSQIAIEGAEQAVTDANKILEEAEDGRYNDTQIAQYESNINTAENNLESAQASMESTQAQVEVSEASSEQTKAQSKSQAHSAEGAYQQALINQSTTYWSTLGETQNAEKQILLAREGMSQAEYQINLTEISLELAELDLDKNKVIAPFDGLVLATNFSQGELASPGVTVISIIENKFIISSQIDETDIGKIEMGQEASFTLDAYYGKNFKGKLTYISPISENIGGIVSYEIEVLPESNQNLIHGLTANLEIESLKAEDILVVPANSVYEQEGNNFVDVLIDEKIEKREIEIGELSYEYAEVRSGLKEGEVIVTSRLENE